MYCFFLIDEDSKPLKIEDEEYLTLEKCDIQSSQKKKDMIKVYPYQENLEINMVKTMMLLW